MFAKKFIHVPRTDETSPTRPCLPSSFFLYTKYTSKREREEKERRIRNVLGNIEEELESRCVLGYIFLIHFFPCQTDIWWLASSHSIIHLLQIIGLHYSSCSILFHHDYSWWWWWGWNRLEVGVSRWMRRGRMSIHHPFDCLTQSQWTGSSQQYSVTAANEERVVEIQEWKGRGGKRKQKNSVTCTATFGTWWASEFMVT